MNMMMKTNAKDLYTHEQFSIAAEYPPIEEGGMLSSPCLRMVQRHITF
jgi:hypothetical protein